MYTTNGKADSVNARGRKGSIASLSRAEALIIQSVQIVTPHGT